jgi:hypothetical protein
LLGVATVTGLVFLASCLVMQAHGGVQRAWDILVGVRSPFGQAAWLGVILSALGYAFVPTAIGVWAANAVTSFVKARLSTDEEAEERAMKRLQRADEAKKKSQGHPGP